MGYGRQIDSRGISAILAACLLVASGCASRSYGTFVQPEDFAPDDMYNYDALDEYLVPGLKVPKPVDKPGCPKAKSLYPKTPRK